MLIVSLLILFLAGNRWVSTSLARSLEWRYPPLPAGQQAPVIIVLAGGTEPLEPPRQTVELNGAGDRVLYAAHLYRQGAAPLLLLCGGDIPWMDTSAASPAEDMQDSAAGDGHSEGGVDPGDTLAEHQRKRCQLRR